MTKPHIQRLEELFHRLAPLGLEERTAALGGLEDTTLRDEVAQLLEADAAADVFLEAGISRDEEPRLSDPAPPSIGGYSVEGILGRGGMGVVYRARDPRLGRAVALKTLSSRVSDDKLAVERLRREARALAAFRHPNIASIHGLEEEGGRHYLVLELVPGLSLAARVKSGPLDWREAVSILRQLAGALEAAHDHGVVHRDVKPSNVMLDDDGLVKLLDFGLAKPFGPWKGSQSQSLTAQNTMIGTCAYMSPEQLRGQVVDSASDIWAFGCVAFELLSGRPVFSGPSAMETVDSVLNDEVDWDALPSTVPFVVKRLIERCLRRKKRDRLRHIGDARQELSELSTDSASVSWSGLRRSPKPIFERPLFRAGAVLLALTTVAVGFGLSMPDSGSKLEPGPSTLRFSIDYPQIGPGDVRRLAVSPDGASIVVARPGLRVRRLDRSEWETLTDEESLSNPFFFPADGGVGFAGHRGISRLSRQGGLPVSLVEAQTGPVGLLGVAAGRDGSVIYATLWSGPLIRALNGRQDALTRLDASRRELSHRWPHLLPDERSVLFVIKDADLESFSDAKIAYLDLRSGEVEILPERGTAPAYLPTGHLLFCRHNNLIGVGFDAATGRLTGHPKVLVDGIALNSITGVCWYDVSPNGTLAYVESHDRARHVLRLQDPAAGVAVLETSPRGEDAFFYSPKVSLDGRSVLVTVVRASTEIWRHDFDRGTTLSLTRGMGNAYGAVWSPDGRRMAFLWEVSGAQAVLAVMSTDGARDPTVLTEGGEVTAISSWSDDGRFVFVDLGDKTETRAIGIYDFQSPDQGVRRLGPEGSSRFGGTLSPDGRWLAYRSSDSVRAEVEVAAFPDLDRRLQVTVGGGHHPVWTGPRELSLIRNGMIRRVSLSLDASPLSILGSEDVEIDEVGASHAIDRANGRVVSTVYEPRRSRTEEIQVVVGWHHEVLAAFGDS